MLRKIITTITKTMATRRHFIIIGIHLNTNAFACYNLSSSRHPGTAHNSYTQSEPQLMSIQKSQSLSAFNHKYCAARVHTS